MAGVERNGFVRVPRWVAGATVTIILGTFITWAVADRQRLAEDVRDIRERITRLETIHQLEGRP